MTMHTITERLARGGGPRRQAAAVAGAILVVVIVIAIVVSAGAPGSSKGQSSGSTASGATTVQRRNLVETDTESGTLAYANSQTVFNRLSGTITYLPNVGQTIKPGGTLFQVDGYPVILFQGSYPAFRDLTSGDSNGPDIEELNADLKAMGYDPDDAITVDQTWQAGTTDAVERFQGAIGQTETGTISLGQIVFLPGPQLINAVDTTLGSTGGSAGTGASDSGSGSSGSGSSDSGASDSSDPTSTATSASYRSAGRPHPEFVDLTTSSTVTPASVPTATTPTCPSDPTPPTTTTPTTTCPPGTSTTPAPTTTTPTGTAPMSSTPGPTSGSLEAIIQLLRTQNKLLQAELKTSKGSTGTGTGTGKVSGGGSGGGGRSAATSATGNSGSGGSSGGSGSSGSGASASSGASSAGGASADAILSTSSAQLVVTVDLDATKQSEAKVNEPVTVELPDNSTVNGKITSVSPVATATSSGSSSASPSASAPSATIPVTVALEKHTDTTGLDQAAVSVNFEEQVANNVLSVPVTALLATQGGGYAVQEAAAPHKLIPVTPGLFAAGYVEISGPDIQDGMQVTDSQG